MKKNVEYVMHFCKNSKCIEGWIDVDVKNSQVRPPRWKYCVSCCQKYGYINPATPPRRKDAEDRIKRITPYQFSTQKKSSITNENIKTYIMESDNEYK